MNIELIGLGTDIEIVERFLDKTFDKNEHFLTRIYTDKELEYCFKDNNYAQHLAGKFCAKEAVIKALSSLGIFENISFKDIEILNNDNKCPYIKMDKYPQITSKLSISHTKDNAIASVILFNKEK